MGVSIALKILWQCKFSEKICSEAALEMRGQRMLCYSDGLHDPNRIANSA